MIVESAVLVVSNDEQSLVPARPVAECLVHILHPPFTFPYGRGRVLMIGKAVGRIRRGVGVRADAGLQKGEIRQIAGRGVGVELGHWQNKRLAGVSLNVSHENCPCKGVFIIPGAGTYTHASMQW